MYLTDQVDELLGDGNGMGAWVQLGPRFLLEHPLDQELKRGVAGLLQGTGIVGDWETRVTRLDVAIDIPDVRLSEEDVGQWQRGWVGRAKVSSTYMSPRSGDLQGIAIGSRRSAVYLQIYDKVAEAIKDCDYMQWISAWDGFLGPVARIEWEVKPNKGGFAASVADFRMLTEEGVVLLVNYLLKWGRLCVPTSDSNNRRWPVAPLWGKVETVVDEWGRGTRGMMRRQRVGPAGVTDKYLRFVEGTVTGAMARVNPREPSLVSVLEELGKRGRGLTDMERDAKRKGEVIERL